MSRRQQIAMTIKWRGKCRRTGRFFRFCAVKQRDITLPAKRRTCYARIDGLAIGIGAICSHIAVVVRAILAMAKSLGIRTVAEGIERHAHRSVLSELGCDIGQGYLYSKPVPYEEFLSFMKAKSAAVNALT